MNYFMGNSIVVDRKFRGVGRIKKATGTSNPIVFRKIGRMLSQLAEEGRLEILRAIRDGAVDIPTVYGAHQRRALHELPLGATGQSLAAAMRAWVPTADYSTKHAGSIETSIRYLERARPKAVVADAPAVLEALRNALGRTHPRSFNLARAAVLAFLRSTLKRSHPLWLAAAAVEPRKVKPTRKSRPLTVEEMHEHFPDPSRDHLDALAWTLAETGMLPHELWGSWDDRGTYIYVEGTKRAGRVRNVPRVAQPTYPEIHRRTFEDAVRERSRDFVVKDLRNTYANWLEAAGIPRTRRKLYLGHGAGDVTGLYERHEVEKHLAEDAELLKAYIAAHTKSHTVAPNAAVASEPVSPDAT